MWLLRSQTKCILVLKSLTGRQMITSWKRLLGVETEQTTLLSSGCHQECPVDTHLTLSEVSCIQLHTVQGPLNGEWTPTASSVVIP